MVDSTIAGNVATASNGGGLNGGFGDMEIVNSTISGNIAPFRGGGLLTATYSTTISNSTIAFNMATVGASAPAT